MDSPPECRISRTQIEGDSDEAMLHYAGYPFWAWVDQKGYLGFKERLAQGNPGHRALVVLTLFAREVDNGGLYQFLANPTGDYWPEIEQSLELIGAERHLVALRSSFKVFPAGKPPVDFQIRRDLALNLSAELLEILNALDEQLYQGSGVEETLTPYLRRYIDTHPKEFFLD